MAKPTRERSRNICNYVMNHHVDNMLPRERVRLAQYLLVSVSQEDFNYGEFEAAQATERYVKQAIRALRGLSLG